MKVLLYITIVLSITLIGCRNENESYLKNKDFTLVVEFYPSYSLSSRIILQKKDNIKTISLDFIYGNKKRKPIRKGNLEIIKNTELAMPEFTSMDCFGDTIFIENIESNPVSKHQFNKFTQILGLTDLLKIESKYRVSIDGIFICVRFKTDSISHQFMIINPSSESTSEKRLIQSIYYLVESNLKEKDSRDYIIMLHDYLYDIVKDEDDK